MADCYAVLGLIHQQWPPVPGRMKDHIAIPKPNAYQSLHTTVLGPEAHPFEIQIRTWDMHKIAEFGIAAHWSYKENGVGVGRRATRGSPGFAACSTTRRAPLPGSFSTRSRSISIRMMSTASPRGAMCSRFPRGATILDFAYRVHTEVGHTCVGGRINSRWVPLRTELKNGDIVEISTSPQQRPHHDWLNLVVHQPRPLEDQELAQAGGEEASGGGRSQAHRARIPQSRDLVAQGRPGVMNSRVSCRRTVCPRKTTSSRPWDSAGWRRRDHRSASARATMTRLIDDVPVTPDRETASHGKPGPRGYRRRRFSGLCGQVLQAPAGGEDRRLRDPGQGRRGPLADRAPTSRTSCTTRSVRSRSGGRPTPVRIGASPNQVELDMVFDDRSGMLASISQVISAEGSDILSCQLRTEHNDRGFGAMTIVVRDAAQLDRILRRLGNAQRDASRRTPRPEPSHGP